MLYACKENSMLTSCLAACTHLSSTVSQLFEPKVQKIAVFTYRTKNRYFYHIFVSPGDAPGAITLNVVWMEREFDAYKLSRCMCPSKYNRLRYSEIFVKKNRHFIIPLAFDAPVRGFPSESRHPLWYGKTRMVSQPDGEKISKISLFVLTWSTNVTDGRTDTAWQQRPRLHRIAR